MTGSELTVELLELHDMHFIFGVPGDQLTSFYDVLRASQKIKHFFAQTSQAAAFMADGYSRATGKVGVCITPGGQLAVNTAVSIAAAYADSIPLLLITGQIPSEAFPSTENKEKQRAYSGYVDLLNLFKPITKWNVRVESTTGFSQRIVRTFEGMTRGRPGPIHLEIPVDILEGKLAEPSVARATSMRRVPGASHLNALAAEILVQAEYPFIIAGGGVVSAEASLELIQIAEILNAPICVTPMSKGAIPPDHPLSAGLVWDAFKSETDTESPILSLVEQAGAILSVGCRLSQRTTGDWGVRQLANLIQIDIDEKEIGRNYPVRIGIVADAKTTLRQLIQAIERGEGMVKGQWGDFHKPHSSEYGSKADRQVIQILRDVLEEHAIIAVGGEHLTDIMLSNFEVAHRRLFLHACDLRAIGYALPAGLGAKCAYPNRQVVAVTDTEGFLMTGQELTTAMQYELNVTVIIINNQESSDKPDCVKFAESFGVPGFCVNKIDQFAPALKDALTADKPTVIEVRLP